ncbi:hypothetical protein L442_05540 [Klebsiella pneumoniae BIDMC 13]|nr:hypothetical protein L442_05540 [Klebsiella pneumoniae BIDMC 13]EWE84520.1 hypothetical protein L434_10619 [Klebsiella pneumoniae BIDMC 7B]EWE84906.1 hypothetical protein L431_10294 [Klebsiella pneumoniae BIDMC 5]EWE99925.1 hypothetical protein L430_10293 [Klebsiella pneumoniae BIDMC 4]EWF17391.1 hypothetical protein L405_05308 [Klebsiella pneumoniae BWH 36]EWF98789.1 hypothetical protein L433_10372 [Klebsiella pneumoniae BIDMC 7A]KEC93048.1 hypothetical protein L437_08234 [Klebsiella pneu
MLFVKIPLNSTYNFSVIRIFTRIVFRAIKIIFIINKFLYSIKLFNCMPFGNISHWIQELFSNQIYFRNYNMNMWFSFNKFTSAIILDMTNFRQMSFRIKRVFIRMISIHQ